MVVGCDQPAQQEQEREESRGPNMSTLPPLDLLATHGTVFPLHVKVPLNPDDKHLNPKPEIWLRLGRQLRHLTSC